MNNLLCQKANRSAGKGKSTLANVLTGVDEFEESTKRIHGTAEEFEYEGMNYRVIDTVGIGDSAVTKGEILTIFDDHVIDYTTIACTNFPDFEDHDASTIGSTVGSVPDSITVMKKN
ncbi:21763_t:CDS:2 [Dentiscutata erythropus]|uniref:21763_t:CDS:1 n=1 Tax=Dentiscutata erythropus TaxID=1348616 RepID=A0A9N8Z6Z9_9GLOM|nr:21763_t:CDS:2 [Dentiscutata erythropus]